MFRAAQAILLISIFAFASIAFASVPATVNQEQSNTDSGVSSEEYEIYSSVIKDLYMEPKTKQIVIEERTFRYDFAVQDDEPWRDKWKDKKKGLAVDDSAADDYESKNGQKWLLNKDSFKLPVKVTLITDLDLKSIFHGNWGELPWIDYYRKFPDARGFVMISRIGFNTAKNQALIYVGSRCGPGCGDLHFLLLQKENRVWVTKKDLRKKEYR
ncbi:MAG TPA: hypothetical protein VKN18_02055 [Blastocatellia bacterium]|nr:hypothetical protein [Blastocatellia bacterium]